MRHFNGTQFYSIHFALELISVVKSLIQLSRSSWRSTFFLILQVYICHITLYICVFDVCIYICCLCLIYCHGLSIVQLFLNTQTRSLQIIWCKGSILYLLRAYLLFISAFWLRTISMKLWKACKAYTAAKLTNLSTCQAQEMKDFNSKTF